ncbi:MAG TPA: Ig-like domain-containing protein [Terriglobales bacterium]|jgi:hypothetical protein|nr:Ig-like domain-containing protein [Terriglobales bacterium]
MRARFLAISVLLICAAPLSRAGGPAFVAGSGYNSGVEGQALVWANGSIEYFTDQGSLSPILSNSQANALVAATFAVWTTIPGVALTATSGGQLAEDVNGSNIQTNGYGVVTAPADITSSDTSAPVGIVYDYDGTVTDAILGEGAGGIEDCFTNAVYGGPDNFSPAGNIIHSLVVINGICAATTAQLPDVQYRLIRSLGRTIGMGWSQANVNVQTRNPVPSTADFAGFPVMHFTDSIACVPIAACYPNPDTPAMDDMDSLARLYPGSNPQPTGRVYGSVYFTSESGNAIQPMQGVNVVARLMVNGQPSRQYVATSVSGFSFCGNAGNIIDGYLDGNGLPCNIWGSSDPSLEGFFDLGQLTIPTGQTTAEYQLSVEGLDPNWSLGVISYAPNQVTPSGEFAPVVVTVTSGSKAERDILMLQDEIATTHPGSGSTYLTPAALPQGGSWGSWISGYGSTDYFQFTAQANRTASVAVVSLGEAGQPTENKLMPVIGIWELSDQSGDPAPASTPSAFNSIYFATTRLDAQFSTTEAFRIGVADWRGDGRPDYFYQANLLYSDSLTPARLSLAGGITTLKGIGFSPALQVTVAGNNAATLSASASQIQASLPAASLDGTATIQITDPANGAFSQMIGALTYGAAATDLLLLLQGAEPATPVGSVAASPLRVRAVAADGVTPVNGATIAWSATNGLQFSACSGASSCSVLTDEAGESSTYVTPTATGPSTVTIALAPAAYSPPQAQLATVVATSTTLDLAAVAPTRWIAQGASLSVPLTVEALNLGAPLPNATVNFQLTRGTASLSAASATTNAQGFAAITASFITLSTNIQVTACVAPNNAPCQTFTLFATPPSLWTLETVSGSSQAVPANQPFQQLVMRVTDGSPADNPVMGVNLTFATTLARPSPNPGGQSVILGGSQSQALTAQDGTASIIPSAATVVCNLFIVVTTGNASAQFQLESLASIVLPQPQIVAVPPRAVPIDHLFAAQPPQPQPLPTTLNEVPESIPLNDFVSHQDTCPEGRESDVSSNDSNLADTRSPCQPPAQPKIEARPADESPAGSPPNLSTTKPGHSTESDPPDGAPQHRSEAPSANLPGVADASVSNSPLTWILEDKRNCRFAQNEGQFVFRIY